MNVILDNSLEPFPVIYLMILFPPYNNSPECIFDLCVVISLQDYSGHHVQQIWVRKSILNQTYFLHTWQLEISGHIRINLDCHILNSDYFTFYWSPDFTDKKIFELTQFFKLAVFAEQTDECFNIAN